MELLDSIDVRGAAHRRIELCLGDLSALEPDDAFDLLVVSAFPGDYSPTPHSLIGALARKGLSVEALAGARDVDLRQAYSCWLSREFSPVDPGLRFRRLLCFEPLIRGRPPELVGDIFRALTPILAEQPEIRSIALPVVAAGDQGYALEAMLAPLLQAALHWLEAGLPLARIKIVIHDIDDRQPATVCFAQHKTAYMVAAAAKLAPATDYDVFISYARANAAESEVFEQALRAARPNIRIFIDRKELDIGAAWQPEIFESLDRCRRVVALLSPDYVGSKVCKEEFNIAWIRARECDDEVIFPIYLRSAALPTYMRYRNFLDCREGDHDKLAEASRRLLAVLGKQG